MRYEDAVKAVEEKCAASADKCEGATPREQTVDECFVARLGYLWEEYIRFSHLRTEARVRGLHNTPVSLFRAISRVL